MRFVPWCKRESGHSVNEETRQNRVPLASGWFVRVCLAILLAVNLFKVACYKREIRSWREVAWKDVRYLDALEHRGAIRDVGEGVDVRVDRVLVYLLGPLWDHD
jgi:hypothetical protein